jgi:uncharacterized integral membrane protein
MTGVRKVKVAVGIVVVLYLVSIALMNREPIELLLLPRGAASIHMGLGLLAVLLLLAGFAIGFFFGRASVKQ